MESAWRQKLPGSNVRARAEAYLHHLTPGAEQSMIFPSTLWLFGLQFSQRLKNQFKEFNMQIQQAYASLSSSEMGKSAAFFSIFYCLWLQTWDRLLVAARLVIAMLIICLGLIVLMRSLRIGWSRAGRPLSAIFNGENGYICDIKAEMGMICIYGYDIIISYLPFINKLEFPSYLVSNKLKWVYMDP